MEKKVAAVSALVACSIMTSGCQDLSAKRSLDMQRENAQSMLTTQARSDGAVTKEWISQYSVFNEGNRRELEKVQWKLNSLKASTPELDPYSAGKSQCWIDVARRQMDQGDKWGGVVEAIGQADRINGELAAGQVDRFGSPPLRTVKTVRRGLWEQLKADFDSGRYASCPEARRAIACDEVMLEYAGHLAWTTDYRSAVSIVDAVEKSHREREDGLKSCPSVQVPDVAAVPVMPRSSGTDVTEMREETLFAFGSATIMQPAKEKLDRFIAEVNSVGEVKEYHVTGYTDRLGSDGFNARLSLRRAQAVRNYIASRTNWPATTPPRGLAKEDPVVQCDLVNTSLTACLAPNRRVVTVVLRSNTARDN